jgi:pilus assembly protein CpaD
MKNTMRAFALVASTAVIASGCATKFNGAEHAMTVQEAHPITVDSQTVTMTLTAGSELSEMDQARLRAFVGAYLQNGHGPVTITTPSGSGANAAADTYASSIRKTLHSAGLDYGAMSATSYIASAQAGNDVVLSYTHYVATPSACGVWEGLRDRDNRNMRTPNFGCATQNNLAAMIGDPRDLIVPADMTAPDAAFRIRGVKAFREGDVTSSARDGEIEAETSQ